MHVGDYLRRIGYDRPIDLSAETLGALHRAHMTAVPFENLDIHLGVPILLLPQAFYEKIVLRRRGGFCYELNGLFAWLLEELGFDVTLHSARVASPGRLSPDFDHLVLSVALGDRWIADVGFGDSSLDPLRAGDGGEYSIVEEAGVWTMRRGAEPQYLFSLLPRRLEEFEERSLYQQTSPDSHFTKSTICSLPTPGGRISLSGRKLIETTGGRREEREIRDAGEYRRILRERFGVELTAEEAERLLSAAS